MEQGNLLRKETHKICLIQMIDMPLRPLISIILRSLYEMVLVLSFRLLEVECINEK